MSILIVGEKPSVSRAISAMVGASSAHKGYTEGNGYIVSWCVGHLVGLKFPNDYGNGWEQRFRHKVYIKNVLIGLCTFSSPFYALSA